MNATAIQTANNTQPCFRKTIDKTTYVVRVHFSETAKETMQEVVDLLRDEHGWSDSVSNLSAKLQRESIRYKEVVELADVLGYDIVWQKRRDRA